MLSALDMSLRATVVVVLYGRGVYEKIKDDLETKWGGGGGNSRTVSGK